MDNKINGRIIITPTAFAKDNLLFVQEIGTLTSRSPHASTRENIHSFLFMIVVKGSGRFQYKDEISSLSEGDCVFVDCHEHYAHYSSADDPWTLIWVHFYGRSLSAYYNYYHELGGRHIFHPAGVARPMDLLNSLYLVVENRDALWEPMSNKFLTDIVTYAFENIDENRTDDKFREIRDYITLHCEDKLSLDSISNMFFISKYYLAREYKHRFGTTIVSDINSERISRAKSLLRFSSDPIDVISANCGFKDTGYFIKVFKASEGITPLAYRKKW